MVQSFTVGNRIVHKGTLDKNWSNITSKTVSTRRYVSGEAGLISKIDGIFIGTSSTPVVYECLVTWDSGGLETWVSANDLKLEYTIQQISSFVRSAVGATVEDGVIDLGRVDVRSYGATGNGTTDDRAALVSSAATGDLVAQAAGHTYRVASDLDLGVRLDVRPGVRVVPDAGVAVTALDYAIGTVALAAGSSWVEVWALTGSDIRPADGMVWIVAALRWSGPTGAVTYRSEERMHLSVARASSTYTIVDRDIGTTSTSSVSGTNTDPVSAEPQNWRLRNDSGTLRFEVQQDAAHARSVTCEAVLS